MFLEAWPEGRPRVQRDTPRSFRGGAWGARKILQRAKILRHPLRIFFSPTCSHDNLKVGVCPNRPTQQGLGTAFVSPLPVPPGQGGTCLT